MPLRDMWSEIRWFGLNILQVYFPFENGNNYNEIQIMQVMYNHGMEIMLLTKRK